MRALDEIAPPALALLEYDGVPAGVAAADRMLKRAPVSLIRAGTVQPGRFLVLLGGSVAAVEEAYAERGAPLDAILLPDAHPALAPALAGERAAAQSAAIGLLEGATSASLLAAADVVLKTTPVGIVELRLADGLGGHAYAIFDGEQADLEVALDAGAARLGPRLTQRALLPRLDDTLRALLAAGSRFADCAPLAPDGAEWPPATAKGQG